MGGTTMLTRSPVLGTAIFALFLLGSGCGIIKVGGVPKSGGTNEAPKSERERARETGHIADNKQQEDDVAKADCSKVVPAKKSFDPLVPQDIPCAAKTHAKLYVDIVCGISGLTEKDKGATLVPGVEVEATGVGEIKQQYDIYTDIKVKTNDGKEGYMLYNCLSRGPIPVSFLPLKAKPASGEAALFKLMKQMFDFAYPITLDLYETSKKQNFKSVDSPDPEYYRGSAKGTVINFYAETLHKLTYGSSQEQTQVLSREDNKWLADWPDEFLVAFADGLKGPAKEKGVPAVETLKILSGFGTITSEYRNIRYEEEELPEKLEEIPESKRESVKKSKLAELDKRKKDTDKKLQEWIDKGKKRKNDVHL